MAILVNKARVCVNIGATPLMTAQVLSVDALDSQLPPLHVSTQQHSEISLDFSKSPCRHLSLPALFAVGEYLYSVYYHYPHGIWNKFPRSGKCFYEWHNRAYLTKASQRPGSRSIFLRESHKRISLFSPTSSRISGSVKVTLEDFLHYSGHDFPSLSIAGIPTRQTSWRPALKKIIGSSFLLQTLLWTLVKACISWLCSE